MANTPRRPPARALLVPVLAAGLGGCVLAPAHAPPAPIAARAETSAPDPLPYRIQVGDLISVRLYLSPELNEDVRVRPDGRVTTTLAEAIPASGRTPEELAAALRGAYARELLDPQLTVEVKDAAAPRFYVGGEVNSPGELVTQEGPNLTLLQAVARAGGMRLSGDPHHVFILRRGAGDTPVVLATDYLGAASGANPLADVRLAPFDVVYVPRTGIARVYAWFNQHVQQFVPVSWGFSYNIDPIATTTTRH